MILAQFSHLLTTLVLCSVLETATSSNITCGPRGAITIAGSQAGITLALSWANDYQQACRNTTISVTWSDSSRGTQQFCGLSSAGSAVDVAIRSRPFQPNEATTTDGYNFKCAQGNKTRSAIQLKVAHNAFVLVVAPNGTAAYCIKHLSNGGLTLQQARLLFSNYAPAKIFNVSTPSPSFTPYPRPPVVPVPVAPSQSKVPTVRPVVPSVSPTFAPLNGTRPPFGSLPGPTTVPTRKPTKAPSRPSPRPTLATLRLTTTYWGFIHFHKRAGATPATAFCNNVKALVAGPPIAWEEHQDFAKKVLLEYDRGENVTPGYFGGEDTAKIVNFLQANSNAIAFMSLPDYAAFQNKLQLVHNQDASGKSRAPNASTLTAGLYPLSYDVFMEVRSDDLSALARLRPFFSFAYSSQGGVAVSSAGLVSLANASRVQMLTRLFAPVAKPLTRAPVVAPVTKKTRRTLLKAEKR